MTAKEFLRTHSHQTNEENLIEFAKIMARDAYTKGWDELASGEDIKDYPEQVAEMEDFLNFSIK